MYEAKRKGVNIMLESLLLATTISSKDMDKIVDPILQVCKILVPSLLGVVVAVGAIYCIILGLKYAKADDPQEHEKAKQGLKNAIIGFIIIFVLLIMIEIAYHVFLNFYQSYDYTV